MQGRAPRRVVRLDLLVGFGVVAACAGQGAVDTGEVDDGLDRGELRVEEPEPEWGARDVEDAVLRAFSGGVPVPGETLALYLEIMAFGDPACPGDEIQILDTWLQGCTADSGWWYAGISEWQEVNETSVAPKGVVVEVAHWALLGDFSILSPEGDEFHSGGHISSWRVITGHLARFGGEIAGSWLWEGDEGWLDQEVSSSLVYEGFELEGHVSVELNGGITVQGVSLNLDHLRFTEACRDQPEGTLGVRDPVGGWHTVELTACEPCGQLVYDHEALGEVCPDLSGVGEAVVADMWAEGP